MLWWSCRGFGRLGDRGLVWGKNGGEGGYIFGGGEMGRLTGDDDVRDFSEDGNARCAEAEGDLWRSINDIPSASALITLPSLPQTPPFVPK